MTTAKSVQQTTVIFQCISCNERVNVRAEAIQDVPWHCLSPMPWFGIRGGLSERERKRIINERNRAVA